MNPLLDEMAARPRHQELQQAARQRHVVRAALAAEAERGAGEGAKAARSPLARLRLWLAGLGAPRAAGGG